MTQSRGKGTRPSRIASEIRRELPDILRRHVDLPNGVLLSVTDVEVSSDLSHARIFFSVVSDREDSVGRDIEALLNGKRGLVRSEIAQRLVMRQHPELRFSYDETPARAAHIESLLRQISDEKRTSEDRDS